MKIYPIETGNFKLDGGAMFGVVPKVIWQKTNPPDSNNLIDMALRCMLIEDGNSLTLIDNGTGDKQSEKFFSYYLALIAIQNALLHTLSTPSLFVNAIAYLFRLVTVKFTCNRSNIKFLWFYPSRLVNA